MQTEQLYDKQFIRHLIKILDKNLDNEHFGVSELAVAANVSRSHLHRKVHAYNGNSTSQFIREYRLNKAIKMLQSNGETVAEVAYKVGFSSPTYFNTCFKELYGFSPGEVKYNKLEPGLRSSKQKKVLLLSSSILTIILIVFAFYFWTPDRNEPSEILNDEITETSIAVLPMNNWSGDPDLEYVSDGMTDAIITKLSSIGSQISIIPFRSVIKYKASDQSAPAIAKELGVDNILQGNLQLSGERIIINLHLIDGTTNRHYWSEQFAGNWNTDDIFNIQTRVAERVAAKMNIEINELVATAIKKNPTQNKEAYKYWLKANFYGLQYTKAGMESAIPLYEKAISLDSTFFEAYVNLAYLHLFGGASWGMYSEQEAWFKAKELLLKARDIDSTNLKVKGALVDGLYFYEWDFDTMEKNYRAISNLSIIYNLQTGRYDEALSMSEKGLEVNPASMFDNLFRAQALYFKERREEATEVLKFSDDFYSDQIMYLRIASRFYYYLGEYERSKALMDRLLANFPDRPPVVLWLSAVNAYQEGDSKNENMYLMQLQARYNEMKSGSPAWFTALYYNSVGDRENAFKWLKNSFNRHEAELVWLREEPALRSLRGDPRYKELYHKVGFPMPPHSD